MGLKKKSSGFSHSFLKAKKYLERWLQKKRREKVKSKIENPQNYFEPISIPTYLSIRSYFKLYQKNDPESQYDPFSLCHSLSLFVPPSKKILYLLFCSCFCVTWTPSHMVKFSLIDLSARYYLEGKQATEYCVIISPCFLFVCCFTDSIYVISSSFTLWTLHTNSPNRDIILPST